MQRRMMIIAALGVAACGGAEAPPELLCEGQIYRVADAVELTTALAAAVDGDCIGLESGRYQGTFTVAAAIGLGPVEGASPQLAAPGPEGVPLTVSAAGAQVRGLTISEPSLDALLVTTGPVRIDAMTLGGARRAAVEIRCEEQGCLMPSGVVVLAESSANTSNNGIIVDGARLRTEGCRVEGNTTQSLSGGAGVVAYRGAHLELTSTNVTNNDYGVLLDGATTTASLEGTTVQGSRERGVWAQGLRGTIAAPALSLGGGTRLVDNRVVGLGSLDSQGVVLRNAQVVGTILTPISINVVETVEIGDGIGLLAGSAEVLVENSTLTGNGRAQAVVDQGGANLVFGQNTINGALKLVVQGTTPPVVAPAADLSTTPEPLPIVATPIALP